MWILLSLFPYRLVSADGYLLYNGNSTDVIPLDVVISACRTNTPMIAGTADIGAARTRPPQCGRLGASRSATARAQAR